MRFHSRKRGLNNVPKAVVKRGRRHSNLLLSLTHHIQSRGADWGRFVCVLLFDCTPTWNAKSAICRLSEFAVVNERRGEAIKVHRPQMQCGHMILYSAVTAGDSALIRERLCRVMICVNTLCRSCEIIEGCFPSLYAALAYVSGVFSIFLL